MSALEICSINKHIIIIIIIIIIKSVHISKWILSQCSVYSILKWLLVALVFPAVHLNLQQSGSSKHQVR